jgi:hypothetical protein
VKGAEGLLVDELLTAPEFGGAGLEQLVLKPEAEQRLHKRYR